MAEPLSVGLGVSNRVALKALYAEQAKTGNRPPVPGWMVVALFLPAADGQLTCIDYRVRAIPDTHDLPGWQKAFFAMAEAMTNQHAQLPAPTVTPGGVPRYVFEEASQVQLLKAAQKTANDSEYYRTELSPEVRGWLASGGKRKSGRPPSRGLAEKLRILRDVEAALSAPATRGAPAGEQPLNKVANKWGMSRSGLRDLLSWARKDASPRLFTNPGQGRRGGALTPEARALLDEIEGTSEHGQHRTETA